MIRQRVQSAAWMILAALAVMVVGTHGSDAPTPKAATVRPPVLKSYTEVLHPEGPSGITVTVTQTASLVPSPTPRAGTVQLVSQCLGCAPETWQVTHSAMACAPPWAGVPWLSGCNLWHQAIQERFYVQSASDLYGNYGPEKVWHSARGHWPSYIDCYDHGGFGVSIAVEGCKWSGPNPARAFFGQHISAAVYYQTCAATKVGPVCRARRIILRDYPDGHVTARTR